MKFEEILFEKKTRKLLLLDIDDTILKAKNIFIYKKVGEKEIALSPEKFAKENVTAGNNWKYDFRDFRDAEKVARSIKTATPIIDVLKFMDHYISKGWKVGILTARGMQDTVENALRSWLMYRKKESLKMIGSKLKEVFAVGDEVREYKGETSYEKKANVIKDLSKQYDKIIFVDDDKKNIEFVKSINLANVKAVETSEIQGQ